MGHSQTVSFLRYSEKMKAAESVFQLRKEAAACFRAKKYSEAITLYQSIRGVSNELPSFKRVTLQADVNSAVVALHAEDYSASVQYSLHAIANDPLNFKARYLCGKAYRLLGDNVKSKEQLLFALNSCTGGDATTLQIELSKLSEPNQ